MAASGPGRQLWAARRLEHHRGGSHASLPLSLHRCRGGAAAASSLRLPSCEFLRTTRAATTRSTASFTRMVLHPLMNRRCYGGDAGSGGRRHASAAGTRPSSTATGQRPGSAASTTIDEEEVARLSESGRLKWWDPEGEMKPLHRMNPKRVAYLRTCLTRRHNLDPFSPRPFAGLRFLDLGCGPGLLTESLARLGGNVLGVDASEPNIKTAIKHAGDDPALSSLTYRVGTAEMLASEERQFDVVCSLEVIEHVNNPELFLSSLCQLIKPGGSLFLSTINRTIKSYALAIVGAEYVLGWVPPGTHQWNKFVQPTELAVLLQRERMHIEELTGLEYQPLRGSWSFTTDTSVNYLLWATKPDK